jgi:hypothetical protein
LACALSNGLVQVYDQERLHLTSCHAIFGTHQQQQSNNNNNNRSNRNNNNIIHEIIYGPQNSNVIVAASQDGAVSVLDLRMGGGGGTSTTTTTTTTASRFSFSSTSSNISNSSSTSASSSNCNHDLVGVVSNTNSIVARAQLPGFGAALSVSLGYDGYLCAVGSNKARVHFFDLRSPHQLLGTYVDAHTDEVTQVKFGSGGSNTNTLLTASEDGLVCLFDTTQPTEESALRSVLNIGAPCRKVGFCGPDLNTIYCLTGSESVSFWNADSATCVLNFGAATRQLLSQATTAAHTGASDDGGYNTTMSVDYLVDAHWDASSQELVLLAGTVGSNTTADAASSSSSSIGDTALFRLAATNNSDHHSRRREYIPQQHQQQQQQFEGRHHCIGDYLDHPYAPSHQHQQQQQQQFEVCHVLRGGHRGVVRGWCSLSQSVMVTAGEDARLCEWNRRQQGQGQQQEQHYHRSTFLSAPPPQRLPHQQLVPMVAHAGHMSSSVQYSSGDVNNKRSASPVGSPFRRQRHRY